MKLKIKSGEVYFIDDDDFEKVNKIIWHRHKGYLRGICKESNKKVLMHRYIMGLDSTSSLVVDHINHDGLNNTKSNLRICTRSENAKNRKPKGNSKYLGVSIKKAERIRPLRDGTIKTYINKVAYKAEIKTKNGRFYLGSFDKEIDAAKAYNKAALKYHGEFANINIFT